MTLLDRIDIALKHRKAQRLIDARQRKVRKIKAYLDLEASVAKNLAAQEREDRRALRRLAKMRGAGFARLRQA